ncbi:MAG: YlxM family DNA-binding protein [Bacillota bacterium]|nr:YlxM family DNA-binding protein [Bacillota bacterium]
MLEKLNRINLLYDIYAPLLTERQREIIQLYFSENYSLAEIAEEDGISRQAIHDLIQRALNTIEKLESKLGLYKLFNHQQDLLAEAEKLLVKNELSSPEIQLLRQIINRLRKSTEQ